MSNKYKHSHTHNFKTPGFIVASTMPTMKITVRIITLIDDRLLLTVCCMQFVRRVSVCL